jgi:sulfatase maturation enzyme AslB (radical SAM superfamily)
VELPDTVQIETAMACNLRCPMCPVPTHKTHMDGRPAGAMPLATFERIIEQISDKPRVIGLTMMGEPMINKNLVQFVQIAKARGHYVAMTTNGTLLNEAKAKALLEAGIDMMKISFDGASKETYERIRIGADFDKVVANVRKFNDLRTELRASCQLQIHCIESDLTRSEISTFKEMWAGVADECQVIQLDNWVGQMDIPPEFGFNPAPEAPQAEAAEPPMGCHFLWNVLSISDRGSPIYCCFDYKLQSGLPTVHQKSLSDIWNDEVQAERERHIRNEVNSKPCQDCAHWVRIKKAKDARLTA